jgi:hypothetical protein
MCCLVGDLVTFYRRWCTTGGNGEGLDWLVEPLSSNFPDHTSYLVAYRGYGASEGKLIETSKRWRRSLIRHTSRRVSPG